MSKKNRTKAAQKWYTKGLTGVATTALITTIVSVAVSLIVDAVKPIDSRVKVQMDQLKIAMEKDALFIDLAKQLTGRVDSETVDRVKKDVIAYLANSLEKYPTKEEFFRENHRYVDKEQGVIWESRMENGNMTIYAVGPYTNETSKTVR